ALMAETKKRFEEATGGVILEGYSLTEAQMAVVANPARGEKKLGSVGMPLPDVRLRIVDAVAGTTTMPSAEAGEIVLSSRRFAASASHRTRHPRSTSS
ncbi:MAG: AMP-dependent synthetase, partial [Gemmatimonadetes bacterium]